MRSDALCVVTNFFALQCYCETFDVARGICVKLLRIREDLGPRCSIAYDGSYQWEMQALGMGSV